MGRRPNRTVELGAPLAGLASPILLASVTLLVAAGRPDYSPVRDAISELAAVGRPGGVIARWLGVVPAGVLTALAAPAAYGVFGPGGLSRWGAAAQALAGLAFVGTGLAPWVGGATDLAPAQNQLHLMLALAGFALLGLAPLLFGLHRRAPVGHGWSWGSLAASAAVFAFGFGLARPPDLGLFQRAALASFYIWLIGVCLARLWRVSASAEAD